MPADDIARFEPSELFSEVVGFAGLIYLSGQVAIENRGGPFERQAGEVLERLDRLIARAGGDRSRILSARVILTSADQLATFNELWSGWLPAGCAPARTTWIAGLTSSDFALEIDLVTAKG
jgi:enamine deaminase RidA (YjgF/YER057c/UK114 family)